MSLESGSAVFGTFVELNRPGQGVSLGSSAPNANRQMIVSSHDAK